MQEIKLRLDELFDDWETDFDDYEDCPALLNVTYETGTSNNFFTLFDIVSPKNLENEVIMATCTFHPYGIRIRYSTVDLPLDDSNYVALSTVCETALGKELAQMLLVFGKMRH